MSANPFETFASHDEIKTIVKDVLLMTNDEEVWTLETIETNFFEKIMLMAFEKQTGDENKVVLYLFNSYVRLQEEITRKTSEVFAVIEDLIFRNISTALKEPEIFPEQDLSSQIIEIFKDNDINDTSTRERFLSKSISKASEEASESMRKNVKGIFFKCFDECMKAVSQMSLINSALDSWTLNFLMAFVSDKKNEAAANLFLDYINLPSTCDGIKYSETLLGKLLCISLAPKNNQGPYEYYDSLYQTNITAINNLSSSLWTSLSRLHDELHTFVKGIILIGGKTRDRILNWIGTAITSNIKRGQIWNSHQSMILGNFTTAPDSFMIGLAAILLRLCQPLMKRYQLKVLLVDPTYSAVKAEDADKKGIHMKIDSETCLVPFEENDERISADSFNFITEIFFMTQKAIDLSYRVCIEKVTRMNRDIHRTQGAYQDAARNGGNSEVTENIMNAMMKQSQQLLCLQNLILEPKNDQLLQDFYEASAIWVTQLAARSSLDVGKGFAPQTIIEISLPLANESSEFLKYVPEMILENLVGYLQFSSKHVDSLQRQSEDAKNIFLTMILIFMGSNKRAKNPHLRASLAEGLESLLPKETMGFSMGSQVFQNHEFRLHIVENLLNVFVSIEMTGQSVSFEQKFNYRRPMYQIMEFLWNIDEQRECFSKLSREVEMNIESVEAPIYLRFVNVLINDSIYLLDESLTNLSQIRELEEDRDNNKWDGMPQREREQQLATLQHLGMIARFNNILGRDTINILKLLTSQTRAIFTHDSMVDRIASMLNYFLLKLTGPKQKNFKVKNKNDFDFDPANTVKQICAIYLNLKNSKNFLFAITQDGRSYSPELFKYAENTLIKIGGGDLITEIIEFADRVQKVEREQKLNDEALMNPPDEFLDPILSILMKDPVILPSSKVVVDRTTISRHLLSDQSDPFNRNPLSMDQLIPDVELKAKIDEWIKERLNSLKS